PHFRSHIRSSSLFIYTDTSSSYLYTLSLHDALPILFSVPSYHAPTVYCNFSPLVQTPNSGGISTPPSRIGETADQSWRVSEGKLDRKSTRLNSSHSQISYAVFCLKKKINNSYISYDD